MKINNLIAWYFIGIVISILFPLYLYYHNNSLPSIIASDHPAEGMRFSIDSCKFENGILSVNGWAFMNGKPPNKVIRIYYKNEGRFFQMKTKTNRSPDVSAVFGGDRNLGNVRFYASKSITNNLINLTILISIEDSSGGLYEKLHKC